jgi:hypothetical protein
MNAIASIVSIFMLSAVLPGCEQHPVSAPPSAPPSGVSQAAPTSRDSAPTVDPSLPSLETAKESPKSGTDSKAGSVLTRTERDTKMPLPGQANDHSTPDIAKKGDSTSTAKPAQ